MTDATTGAGSAATRHAVTFVADHRAEAERLGHDLAEQLGDPEAFAADLRQGLAALADPAYLAGQRSVAPGLGTIHGVRWPLLATISRGLRQATREDSTSTLLFVADRLVREPHLEARWLAFGLLERTLLEEAERTWQLLRRAARDAADWITVDALARPYGVGIDAEPYRWAELEQLVYSSSRWERRLVGSTIATMTHGNRRTGRGPEIVRRALPLLGALVGDAQPDVQKALAWAYRSLARLDPGATLNALQATADQAVAEDDGYRAWVVRDSLAKLPPAEAADLRRRLVGIRRRPGARSTSTAAITAGAWGSLPDPSAQPEPPLA